MIILGIDPGTVVMGFGIIESDNGEAKYLDCGTITTNSRSPIGERLSFIYNHLSEIIRQSHPDAVAIEQPFVAKNVKSAFAIGRAQAIGIVAAANNGISVYEYSPTQVKQRVTSYGASSKEQVQEMVRLQLGLAQSPEPYDAADALAVALCHIGEIHMNNLLLER